MPVLSVFDKPYTKPYFFSFCEQTLKMAANDASGQGLQSAQKNRHQNNFSRKKVPVFQESLFSLKIRIYSFWAKKPWLIRHNFLGNLFWCLFFVAYCIGGSMYSEGSGGFIIGTVALWSLKNKTIINKVQTLKVPANLI